MLSGDLYYSFSITNVNAIKILHNFVWTRNERRKLNFNLQTLTLCTMILFMSWSPKSASHKLKMRLAHPRIKQDKNKSIYAEKRGENRPVGL